jgi:phenylacetate-CoA ligase
VTLGRLAYAHVVHPLYHLAKRDGVNRAVRELRRNQWLSANAIDSIRHEKLQRLLVHAHRHVPYYRDAIDALGVDPRELAQAETFARLPVLTKAVIRRNHDRLQTTALAGNRLHLNSTSGSTGEPLKFYTDDSMSTYHMASVIRNKEWTGWRMSSREACLWGAPVDANKAKAFRGRMHGRITGSLFLSAYDMTEEAMDRYVSDIAAHQPFLLVSYPSILEVFAAHCRRRNSRFESLRAIITSAETMSPDQRDLIEKTFGTRVFNRYGSREVGDIAHECASHTGLHVNSDCVLVEIVGGSGRPCSRGETGDVLVTSLHNYGMPLIRYAIGDRASWSLQTTCECGRGLPLLAGIEGRSMDVVSTRSGKRIGGTYWTILLRSRPGFTQFQVVQDTPDGITVRFIRDDRFDAGVLEYYTQRIREKCGAEFQVLFQEEKELERTAAGKRRLVVSNVDRTLPA